MSEKQNKIVGLDEALKEDNQSEGSIQEVVGFDTEILITDGLIKQGTHGSYALITLNDAQGKQHIVNSSAKAIVEKIEQIAAKGLLNNGTAIACTVKNNPPSKNGKNNFFTLENI